MNRPSKLTVLACSLPLLLLAGHVLGQSYDLAWNTIDGGGGTSTGGTFALSGTIGQPNALSPAMSGGTFTLTGGFWPGVGGTCAMPGDMNLDGLRDGADIQSFLNCLLTTGANCSCADVDGNGSVNGADVAAFVSALLS